MTFAPVMESFYSPAAASSGSAGTGLYKSGVGSQDPTLTTLCNTGAETTVGRGSVVFSRTEGPATICVTVTLNTGLNVGGRAVYILQSTAGTGCVDGTVTPVGTWALSPLHGPQTFCAPIANGATRFVVALQQSGGGGNDGWSSDPPVSLP